MFQESVAALPSFWASVNTWFTPTVFFVLLNIMIGTIALTSSLGNQNNLHTQTDNKLARSPSLLQRVRSINFSAHKQEHQQDNLGTKTVLTSDATHFSIEPNNFFIFEDAHKPETLEDPSQYVFEEENVEFMQTQDSSVENVDDNSVISSGSYHLNQESEGVYGEESDEVQSLQEVFSEVSVQNISRTKSDTEPASGEVPKKLPRKMRKSASVKSAFGHFQEEEIVERRRPATVRERERERERTEADGEVDAKADDFINNFKQQLKLQRVDSIARYKDMITRGSAK